MKFLVRHNDTLIQVACAGSEEYENFKIGGEFQAGGQVRAGNPYRAIAIYVDGVGQSYWEPSLRTLPRQIQICWGDGGSMEQRAECLASEWLKTTFHRNSAIPLYKPLFQECLEAGMSEAEIMSLPQDILTLWKNLAPFMGEGVNFATFAAAIVRDKK